MENDLRNVLMILYYFPPSGGPGVQRGLKFVRYLPAFGWQPTVLTVRKDAAFPVRDETLSDQVPAGVRVIRTRCPEFYGIYSRLLHLRKEALDVVTRDTTREGTAGKVLRFLRASLFIPDGRMAWQPFAWRAGKHILSNETFHAIFSSGPPFTTHLIARRLARWSGLPWVADYRDPWTQAPFYPKRPGPLAALEQRLERACLEDATATVVVGNWMKQLFLERYPDLDPERVAVIPNGFDEADFEDVPIKRPDHFRITYTGTMPRSRSPRPLLQALDLVSQKLGPTFANSLRLCFAGRLDPAIEGELRGSPFSQALELLGYLPHAKAIRLMRQSAALLLIVSDDPVAKSMVTGKVFEYVASGVPILALAPADGDAAAVIEETATGWTYEHTEIQSLAARIEWLWHEYAKGNWPPITPRRAAVQRYSRRHLARHLADLLEGVRDGSEEP